MAFHRTNYNRTNDWSTSRNHATLTEETAPQKTLRSCAALLLSVLAMACLLRPMSVQTRDLQSATTQAKTANIHKATIEPTSTNATVTNSSSTRSNRTATAAQMRNSNKTYTAGVKNSSRSNNLRIPTVLLAGTQKASTASLAKYLMALDNVCFSNDGQSYQKKESHFFDNMYDQGLTKYQQLYQHCADNDTLIEGTSSTQLFPDRVRAIYDEHGTTPDVKIIFILHEPVSCEISWYNQRIRDGKIPVDKMPEWIREVYSDDGTVKDFMQVQRETVIPLLLEPERGASRGASRGNYVYWLQHWFDLFDRSTQILILSYDELTHDTESMLLRVHQFLNLPMTQPLKLKKANSKGKSASSIPCKDQNELAAYFKESNTLLPPFLESHPGPSMEQSPFPPFDFHCEEQS